MKTRILKSIALLLFMVPLMVMAQNPLDELYRKYAGKDGFTSISISPQMFQMFGEGDFAEGDNVEFSKALSDITSMKILSYEYEGKGELLPFREEVEKALNLDGFEELMVIDDGEGGGVKFLARKTDGKISQFLMLAGESDDFTVMSFTGSMDIETIGKLSKSMQMEGMYGMDNGDDKDEEEEK